MTPGQAPREHVLVVNTGKPEAVTRLVRSFDVRCTVLTEEQYARLYPNHQSVVTVRRIEDTDLVVTAARRVHHDDPFLRVVAPTERSILPGAHVRRALCLEGLDVATAERFTDKLRMKEALRRAGLPTALFTSTHDQRAALAFLRASTQGCVLKPARGSGSIGAVRLGPGDDVPARAWTSRMLLERVVPMEAELHSEGLVRNGVVEASRAYEYAEPVLGTEGRLSGSFPVDDERVRDVRVMHQRVVSALGFRRGTTHLQLFATRSGLVVNEIACRPPGGGIPEQVRRSGGFDVWKEFLAAELGRGEARGGDIETDAGGVTRVKLPLPRGRVTSVEGFEQLVSRDGIDGTVHFAVGDEPPAVIHSGAVGGLLFADAATWPPRDVFDLVSRTFRFRSDAEEAP